jgi:putative transcription antitermination factor YqgF
MTRLIGLDHGSKRIGVAIGDTETGMAFARPALRRQNTAIDVEAITRIVRDEEAETVVMGLPRNMDGTEGVQAAAARKFGERLAANGLAVDFRTSASPPGRHWSRWALAGDGIAGRGSWTRQPRG